MVVVSGLRQLGKSTSLHHKPVLVEGRRYPTLDNLDVADQAQREPRQLVNNASELALNPELELGVWFEGYERTYLERDVSSLRRIEDLAGFRGLIRLAALRLGGVLNVSGLAAHLAGVTEVKASSAEPLRGALVENFVLQNLIAALEPHLIGVRFYYWHEQGPGGRFRHRTRARVDGGGK